VRVRLQIIEHANFPAFAQKEIGDMRSDQARATGNKRAFSILRPVLFSEAALGTSAATTNSCWPNAVTAFALDNLGQEFSRIRREAIPRVFTKQLTAQSLQCRVIIDIVAHRQQFHFHINLGCALPGLFQNVFRAPVNLLE
jgi:hypothetical protein